MRIFFSITMLLILPSLWAMTPSQLFVKHKGFMVFLNWYFQQPPPVLVSKYFTKMEKSDHYHVYQGSYGAFDQVTLEVCHDRIATVRASTPALKGGIKSFAKEWLNPTVISFMQTSGDTPTRSWIYLTDKTLAKSCPQQSPPRPT